MLGIHIVFINLEMTSEEVQKRNKRLMQNRLSAWKRRVNDKKYEEELLEVYNKVKDCRKGVYDILYCIFKGTETHLKKKKKLFMLKI